MTKGRWSWGGGTKCNFVSDDLRISVLSGEALCLPVDEDTIFYVGFGLDPKSPRVLLTDTLDYNHVFTSAKNIKTYRYRPLTKTEFQQVEEAWISAKGTPLPTEGPDRTRIEEGIVVGDQVLEEAKAYYYH